MMDWSTAVPDWERRVVAGESLIPVNPLFPNEAAAALEVFCALRIVDMPGQPTFGETCRPWAIEFVASIFGAYDPENGKRLITEFFLLIAKKNSKSTLSAAIMLTALIRNWRHSAEFLILAPTIEIANNSFYPARDMVRADADLDSLFHVQDHIRQITHRTTGAMLKVIAADNETVGGKKATAVLVDELWLFGKQHNAENMLREACGGLASRPEGFVVYLSTHADEPPAGVFKDKLDYARGVRDGRIVDPQFLPVLYEFPAAMLADESYKAPTAWRITNPNLGASVSTEFVARELHKAEETGQESLRGFLAKHLNVEIGLSLRSNRWAGAEFWQSCASVLTLEELLERSEVVTIGVDGGGLDDMLGFCVLGRESDSGRWLHWAHAWIHPIALERRKSEAARYRDFERAGELTIVENIGEDVDQLCLYVKQCEDAGLLDRVGVDVAGINSVVEALTDDSPGSPGPRLAEDRIVGIPQGWKLTGAIKTFERRLAEGKFRHCGTALMAWCVGNARAEPRGNAVVITKQAAGFAKIDPLMATLNAAALMSMNPKCRSAKFQLFAA